MKINIFFPVFVMSFHKTLNFCLRKLNKYRDNEGKVMSISPLTMSFENRSSAIIPVMSTHKSISCFYRYA